MKDDSPEPPERGVTLHEVCDAFEREWTEENRPDLATFLARYDELDRKTLLRELIPVELELRRDAGETPTLEEYRTRFPSADEFIEEFFVTSRTMTIATGTATPHAIELASAPLGQFGDYELLEELGRGGMGVVYRARQRSPNRIVAIKTIRSGDRASGEDLARFKAEAEAVAQLEHPGIVPIYEVGEHEGRSFFSMGFVEGPSLSKVLNDGPLDPRRATDLGRRVADAVAHAHARGIVHRDLKPSNIVLDAEGRPRVTDFGLAKQLDRDSRMTVTNQVLGTPSFMPPEQALGQPVGPTADVYSLAALLYCLVTGRPPFQAATTVETLRQVVEVEPVEPRRLNPSVGRDLETIVLRCLEKEQSRRYPTMRSVEEELGRVLAGEPILARPVGRLERFARWCRRQPGLAAATTGVVLATLVCLVTLVVAVVRINAARNSALEIARRNGHLLEVFQLERESVAETHQRRMDALLHRHVATLCELAVAARNRELDRSAHRRLAEVVAKVVRNHPETVALAVSDDTAHIATGETSGTIRLWDLETGRGIDDDTFGDREVRRIVFVGDDGSLLVIMDDDSEHHWSPEMAPTSPSNLRSPR